MINEYNHDLYKREPHWTEGEFEVTKTCQWTAPGCHHGCGVYVYTKDGKFDHLEGDPNCNINQGRLCMRCLNMEEQINHPDRLKYPMLRDGERGEDKWKRVSWEEAYDWIEERYNECCEVIRNEYGGIGPEGVACLNGTGRNTRWHGTFLTRAGFGGCNIVGTLSGDACYQPRMTSNFITMGELYIVDAAQMLDGRYSHPDWRPPELVVVWGCEPIESNTDGFLGGWIVDMMRMGTKLLTIDPRLSWLAAHSEQWIRLRPGTDGAMALGFLNVIINEDLYDHDFVENWTYGFEELSERVQEYTPEKVAEICWCEPQDVIDGARLIATSKPVGLQWGVAIDMQINAVAASCAMSSIMAITGNIDVPGGCVIARNSRKASKAYAAGIEFLSPEMMEKRIGVQEYDLRKSGFTPLGSPDGFIRSLETGEPYMTQIAWLAGTNPIANTGQDAPRVYKALKKIPTIIAVDAFKTPSIVALADLVLPCAFGLERDSYRAVWNPLRPIVQACDSYYDCKSDEEICLDICKRFNPDFFNQFENVRDFLTWFLQDYGNGIDYTFEDLVEMMDDFDDWPQTYYKYEKGMLRGDGQPGFSTPTGLFELDSSIIGVWGFDSLPRHIEPPEGPVTTPELMEEYPYVLTTGRRQGGMFHSEHRQMDTMREFYDQPEAEIAPETAEKLGLVEGDWAWFENMRGRCKQRIKINPTMDPRVVALRHGWWFPEKEAAEPVLFGVFDSNSNNLTAQSQEGETSFGAPVKSTICKVYKVTEENAEPLPTYVVTREGGFVKND